MTKPLKIASMEAIPLEVPFTSGSAAGRGQGKAWIAQQIVLVRLQTDAGAVGWGEAFSYFCQPAVVSVLERMIAPLVVGQEVSDIEAFMRQLQHALHLFGRYGIQHFALSGLDVALWDLKAKAAGVPLARLINRQASMSPLPGYASLYRYGDRDLVAEKCRKALDQGYDMIKLHEIREMEVKAAREEIGGDVQLTVDTNCPWTPDEARAMTLAFKPYNLTWLEEPIFPPEDFVELARLQAETGMPLAAGENACTRYQFRDMIAANAVTYVQPSVTKLGGVTEFLAVAELVKAADKQILMPHCPYFGPGWLATLQLAAALPDAGRIERLYIDLEASLWGDLVDPDEKGQFRVPDGPGLGAEPDANVIRDYGISL